MTPELLDAMEARALAAKEHEYELDDEGEYDCPLCEDGYTEGRRYESKIEAATIVAYGIGRGLELASTWVEQGPDDVLALVAEVRRLSAKLEEMGR